MAARISAHLSPLYATHALEYLEAGWAPLPVPRGKKWPPPEGYTGNDGAWPSAADVLAWSDEHPDANTALRLPRNVIGLDVDNYGAKPGASTYATALATYGPLPDTPLLTSRADGLSGIRFFRAPEGLYWPGELPGGGVEIIRHGHRYAITWPSIHPEGREYAWSTGAIPHVDSLPDLPQAWIDGLTGGRSAVAVPRADLDDRETSLWLEHHGAGEPCPEMMVAIGRLDHALCSGGSRHEATLKATAHVANLIADGHSGGSVAMHTAESMFREATRGTDREEELDRLITGAVRIAAARPMTIVDPCTLGGVFGSPWADLSETAMRDGVSVVLDAERLVANADRELADRFEASGSSWLPVDLGPLLDGTFEPEVASLMPREDGQCLLYPERIHSLHGQSESGKSLVAQVAVIAPLLSSGEHCLYLDYESDAGSIVERLRESGVSDADIRERFHYVHPDADLRMAADAEQFERLLRDTYAVVVIDGVTDALGMAGLSIKENDDIAKWMREVPRRLADRTGAAVILIDHVVKDREAQGRFAIGGQAKMAGLTGAAYVVEVSERIGRGLRGTITLRIAKDRPGSIRANCGAWRKSDRTQEAARIIIDSTTPGTINVRITPPRDDTDPARAAFRPTAIMEKISSVIETTPSISKSAAVRIASCNKNHGLTAIDLLITEGFLTATTGPNNATLLTSATPYRQATDPRSDAYLPSIPRAVF